MITIALLTPQAYGPMADQLVLAGYKVHEALWADEVLELNETEQIDVVVKICGWRNSIRYQVKNLLAQGPSRHPLENHIDYLNGRLKPDSDVLFVLFRQALVLCLLRMHKRITELLDSTK